MATTTTARMYAIADEREAEGFYTQAFAIRELAEQRDRLLLALRAVTPEEYGCIQPPRNRLRHAFMTVPDCPHCQAAETARKAIATAINP